MRVRHAPILALSVLAVLPSGCRENLSPQDVTGTYVLDKVGDAPVPAVVFTDSRGTVRIIADTLVLGANNRGRLVSVQSIEAQGASAPEPPTRVETGLFHGGARLPVGANGVLASRVAIHYECPINALCAAGPHLIAWREGAWLVVEDTFAAIDARRYYRRVATGTAAASFGRPL